MPDARRRSRGSPKASLPTKFDPQLALLVKAVPEGPDWLHEIKFDGYRIGCLKNGDRVRLLSRNGKDWTARFPSVCDAVVALPCKQALLDGEVAVVLPDGRTSFQALQNAFKNAPIDGELVYFVFDMLHLDGNDLSGEPLERRKKRLAGLLRRAPTGSPIRYSDHVAGHGLQFFEQACRLGAEGVVSKRRDVPYQPGRRPSWVKTKCIKRQELVVGGFTDPKGSRAGIGALLVGVNDASRGLVFAGKVGTGFTQESAATLRAKLDDLEQPNCPFAVPPPTAIRRRAHWVKPILVAEVAFTEWTEDGRVRHPSFQGLRADKKAAAVTREEPVDPPRSRTARSKDRVEVAGVSLSHPDRVVYPDAGTTKLDLARFYESIAEGILPHLAGRPLTLVRCPAGIEDGCFFMKHAGASIADDVRRVHIQENKKVGDYLVVDDLKALISLIQANVIELHTWNATVDRVDIPDRIVFDLDPGPEVKWRSILDAALLVRSALETLRLESFVKTTGGHGLHVVVPIIAKADWRADLAFARSVAEAIVRVDPKRYTTKFAKAGREKKILIDVMRNNRLNTSVAAFSTRARPGAPVSTPLAWDELDKQLRGSDQYTVRNLGQRLKHLRTDPWARYWKSKQRLPEDAMEGLEAVEL